MNVAVVWTAPRNVAACCSARHLLEWRRMSAFSRSAPVAVLLLLAGGCGGAVQNNGQGGTIGRGGHGGSGGPGGTGGPACAPQPQVTNDPACPPTSAGTNLYYGAPVPGPCSPGLVCSFLEGTGSDWCLQPPLVVKLTCCEGGWGFWTESGCTINVVPGQDPRCALPAPGACAIDGLECDFQMGDAAVDHYHCCGGQWRLLPDSACVTDAGAHD